MAEAVRDDNLRVGPTGQPRDEKDNNSKKLGEEESKGTAEPDQEGGWKSKGDKGHSKPCSSCLVPLKGDSLLIFEKLFLFDRETVPICWLTPQLLKGQSQEPETHPRSPTWVAGTRLLEPSPTASRDVC